MINIIFETTFKAFADPIRRKILTILKNGKLSAGEIASYFDISIQAVSYHLNILKKADLISESRYKNFIYYELNTSILDEIILWIKELKESDINEKIKQSDNYAVSDGTSALDNNTDSGEFSA